MNLIHVSKSNVSLKPTCLISSKQSEIVSFGKSLILIVLAKAEK